MSGERDTATDDAWRAIHRLTWGLPTATREAIDAAIERLVDLRLVRERERVAVEAERLSGRARSRPSSDDCWSVEAGAYDYMADFVRGKL